MTCNDFSLLQIDYSRTWKWMHPLVHVDINLATYPGTRVPRYSCVWSALLRHQALCPPDNTRGLVSWYPRSTRIHWTGMPSELISCTLLHARKKPKLFVGAPIPCNWFLGAHGAQFSAPISFPITSISAVEAPRAASDRGGHSLLRTVWNGKSTWYILVCPN